MQRNPSDPGIPGRAVTPPAETRREGPFEQPTHDLGLRVDVTNVAEALEHLGGATAR